MATKIIGRPTWQQTMLRISNPSKTIPFYTDIMGMTVIDTLDFPKWKFKLYFLTTLPKGTKYDLTPGTQAAHVSDQNQTLLKLFSSFFAYYVTNSYCRKERREAVILFSVLIICRLHYFIHRITCGQLKVQLLN